MLNKNLGDTSLKTYEVIMILDPRRVEDNGDKFAQVVTADLEKIGGKVLDYVNMGRRVFARPIGKSKAGIYLDFIIELEGTKVEEHLATYQLNEAVLRHMAFIHDEVAAKYRAKGKKVVVTEEII